MIRLVRRWQPTRAIVPVVDGGLAAVKLGLICWQAVSSITYVSRSRFDAALSNPPVLQPQGKRGPKPRTEYANLHWNVEATFEEARVHLGVETQRQWPPLAIERVTPLLFGLF